MDTNTKSFIAHLKDEQTIKPDSILQLVEMYKESTDDICNKLLNDIETALSNVLSPERIKSFDGKTVTPDTFAVLLQSPCIVEKPFCDVYLLSEGEESKTIFRICVAIVKLSDGEECSFISINKEIKL